MVARILGCLALVAAAAAATYTLFIRPRHLRWGASDEEVRRRMPGDDVVPRPFLNTTRAVAINAPATAIWPWLVQMGYGRAGFYSYDWIDNDRIPSAGRIIPELQDLKVGEIIPTDARGEGFRVAAMEPNRTMVLVIDSPAHGPPLISSATVLDEIDVGHTRMVMRLRANFRLGLAESWAAASIPFWLRAPLRAAFALRLAEAIGYAVFEPGDFVMMRRMMLGIKQRAERVAATA